jgi:serine phosphatase RsbU (regulator of sigma subunit)
MEKSARKKLEISILYVSHDCRNVDAPLMFNKNVEKIYIAENVKAGLGSFLQFRPDILIVDASLSGAEKIDFLREIKKKRKDIPVIVFLETQQNELLRECIEEGVSAFIFKPIKSEKLYEAVEKCAAPIFLERQLEKLRDLMLKYYRANEMIERDLKNSQIIQRALLPHQIPQLDELLIDYRYLPLESVGGDYFSFTILREGGMGVLVGDVAGHGVSAALFIALVKAFADRVCRQYGQDPKEYFAVLNADLLNNMSTNFLTALYGIFRFDKANKKVLFTFSKAGHPSPLLYEAASYETRCLHLKGTILGVIEGAEYGEMSVTLSEKDRLFIYTDGLQEMLSSEADPNGLETLCRLIKKSSKKKLTEALDFIVDYTQRCQTSESVPDDMLIIGFEAQ